MSIIISLDDIGDLIARVKPLADPITKPCIASHRDILNFEQCYGIEMPSELQEWLLYRNGADVNPGGIYGLNCSGRPISIELCLDMEPKWIPKGWIPIAGDGCGDYYVLASKNKIPDKSTHPVFFIDQADYQQPRYVVASSLKHFLWFLLTDEIFTEQGVNGYWPFHKDRVLADDPALESFKGVPLPWEVS